MDHPRDLPPSELATALEALVQASEQNLPPQLRALVTRLLAAQHEGAGRELQHLTKRLREALDRFGHDSRLAAYVQRDIPDARARLAHVVQLTEEAAHRTMDLVERCGPLAARPAVSARELSGLWAQAQGRPDRALLARVAEHLESAARDSEQVRADLAQVVLAQGFQDLSGQIIRHVIELVSEIESALTELMPVDEAGTSPVGTPRGADSMPGPAAASGAGAPRGSSAQGFGPTVPGTAAAIQAVSGQQDVDDLLAGLGV